MSDTRLILSNTVALAVCRVLEKAGTVCLSLAVARYLGAAALGIYSAAMVVFGLVTLAAEMGSTTFLTRELSKDRSLTSSYVIHLGAISAVVSLPVMALCFVLVPHLGYSEQLVLSTYAVACATFPGALKTILEGVFIAHQNVKVVTYLTLLFTILNLGGSIYLLEANQGIASLVVLFAAIQFVTVVCYAVVVHRNFGRLRWGFSLSLALRLLREIRMFTGSSFLAGLATRPEVLILSVCKNDAQIGFYSAALRIVDLWQTIPETYMRNVFPLLSHLEHIRDRRTSESVLSKSIKCLMAVSLPLATGIFVAATSIVQLLYGSGFEQTVDAVRIMAWYIPLSFLHEVLWRVLAARDEQHLLVRAQVFSLVVRLALGYWFITWLASFGAAISVSFIMLFHCSLLLFFVQRDGTRLGILRHSWRLSLAAGGMGVVAAALPNQPALWLTVPTAAVVYAAMAATLGAVSMEDLDLFRKTE